MTRHMFERQPKKIWGFEKKKEKKMETGVGEGGWSWCQTTWDKWKRWIGDSDKEWGKIIYSVTLAMHGKAVGLINWHITSLIWK